MKWYEHLKWYDVAVTVNLNPLNWRGPKVRVAPGTSFLYFGPVTVLVLR